MLQPLAVVLNRSKVAHYKNISQQLQQTIVLSKILFSTVYRLTRKQKQCSTMMHNRFSELQAATPHGLKSHQ